MGWVERVTPWFAVAVIALAAAWLVFPTYRSTEFLLRSTDRLGAVWATPVVYAGALIGVAFIGMVAIRAAMPARRWPPDGAIRAFATLGLLLCAFTVPLIILRNEYGLNGMIVVVAPLAVYYARLRRALVDILPPWAGGTWKSAKRRRRTNEDVIKRPPRTWDATSGTGPGLPRGGSPAAGRQRRKPGKKKRRPGR